MAQATTRLGLVTREMPAWTTVVDSPAGSLDLIADQDGALTHVLFRDEMRFSRSPELQVDPVRFAEVITQLREYFAGTRTEFDVPLAPRGTPFQREVWLALRRIPYGETWSYARQAAAIGRPSAARAVGAANGRNPIGIVVPCHRVIGADGSLTGYGGGIDRKRWLLLHEQQVLGQARVTVSVAASQISVPPANRCAVKPSSVLSPPTG
jgi:methylated-DNA-[protein]-cysteine S-methyltransferase